MNAVTPGFHDKAELTRRTTGSAIWLIAVRLISKGIDFASLLILAALLTPVDFGIIAIAMTLVLAVEAIFELPVSQILVSLPLISKEHLDTAFTLSLLRGLVLAVALCLLAVPFAHFYGDPRLALLIVILSLAPVLRGLISPSMSIFVRKLDFRRDLALDLVGKSSAFVFSSIAAWLLHDYRALMVGVIALPLTVFILSYFLAPYKPHLSLREWSSFSGFLGWTSASQILSAINWQCDRLLLGRYISRAELGSYSLANDLSYIPEQALIKPIVRPLLSAFSLIGDDRERLQSAYAKASSSVLAVGLPLMLGLSLLADPAVHLMLGGKWNAAIPALRWLSLTLIPLLLISPFPSVAMAKGRFDAILRLTVSETLTKIPLMAVGALTFGVMGAIAARALSSLITTAVALHYTKKIVGTPIFRQIAENWRTAIAGAVLIAVILLLRPSLHGVDGIMLGMILAAVGAAGMASYIAALAVLWIASGKPPGFEHLIFNRLYALVGNKPQAR